MGVGAFGMCCNCGSPGSGGGGGGGPPMVNTPCYPLPVSMHLCLRGFANNLLLGSGYSGFENRCYTTVNVPGTNVWAFSGTVGTEPHATIPPLACPPPSLCRVDVSITVFACNDDGCLLTSSPPTFGHAYHAAAFLSTAWTCIANPLAGFSRGFDVLGQNCGWSPTPLGCHGHSTTINTSSPNGADLYDFVGNKAFLWQGGTGPFGTTGQPCTPNGQFITWG